MAQLALQLIAENKNQKALKVLEKASVEIPSYNVPNNYMSGSLDIAKSYAFLGQKAKAKVLVEQVFKNASQYMRWYLSQDNNDFMLSQRECMTQLMIMQQTAEVATMVDKVLGNKLNNQINSFYNQYRSRGGQMPQGQE
jgi:hypothetical protein